MKLIILSRFLQAVIFSSVALTTFSQANKLKDVDEAFSLANSPAVEINITKNVNVEIIPWDGNTLKIVYRFDAGNNEDSKPLSKLGIYVKQSGNRSIIDVNAITTTVIESSDYVVIDGKTYYKVNPRTTVVQEQPQKPDLVFFYIPRDKKLSLTLYHNVKVTIAGDLDEAVISTIGYGGCTLKAKSIRKLDFKCSYPHASFETINEGTLTLTGGQVFITKAGNLSLESRYAAVQIGSAKKMNLISSKSDRYKVDELESLNGVQEHGLFEIGVLKKAIDVSGNGGISISAISGDAESIQIKSKGDVLNLPVKHLKNYAIHIDAPQGILLLTEEVRRGVVDTSTALVATPLAQFLEGGKVVLKSTVGNVKGKHTVFNIICPGCTINFRTQGDN